MKTLLILRHAKSSWKQPGFADHDRPLNRRGNRDAPRVGLLLRRQALTPDLIVSSTAERARATAVQVAESVVYGSPVELDRQLYLAEPGAIVGRKPGMPIRPMATECGGSWMSRMSSLQPKSMSSW